MARPLPNRGKPRKRRRNAPRKADTPRPPPPGKEALEKPEAAYVLGVSVKTVYNLIHAGYLPAVYIGTQVRISRRAIDDYLGRGGTPLEETS